MDAYGPYPFAGMPHVYDEAVRRYGAGSSIKNGTLPWRSEEIYGKLVEAFTQKATVLAGKHPVLLVGALTCTAPTPTSPSTRR